jgi:hypothetical protein
VAPACPPVRRRPSWPIAGRALTRVRTFRAPVEASSPGTAIRTVAGARSVPTQDTPGSPGAAPGRRSSSGRLPTARC